MSLSTTKEASCALFSSLTLLLALTDGSDPPAPAEVESSSLTSSDSAGVMFSVKPLGADSFFSGLVLSVLTTSSSGCSEDNFFLGLGLGMSPSRKDNQLHDSQFYIRLTLID